MRARCGVVVLSLAATAVAQQTGAQRTGQTEAAAARSTPWPTERWAESTPAAEGIKPEVLAAIDGEVCDGKYGLVDAMLVIRNGKVVFERSYPRDYAELSAPRKPAAHQYSYDHPDWHPFYQGTALHTLQSVTKSVASTMIGVAIHRGEISGVDVPALSFFADREFPDPDGRKAMITLENALTMRPGFAWDEWSFGLDDPRNDCIKLESSQDWIDFVLRKPMATAPGSTFVYNSGNSHLLSGIIKAATGVTIDTYAERHLFGPLGIAKYHWKKTPKGLPDTEGGLYLTPRSLAKIGYLFLHDGVWDGRRLLPEGWVAASTKPHVPDIRPDNGRRDNGYGYQWWVIDDGRSGGLRTFAALGYGGQQLFVVPARQLICVFTGWNIHRRTPPWAAIVRDRIAPASRHWP